jgi:hypothetical protein
VLSAMLGNGTPGSEKLLHRDVQRFRGGLVFEKKNKKKMRPGVEMRCSLPRHQTPPCAGAMYAGHLRDEGGMAGSLIRKHDHFTPAKKMRRGTCIFWV